MQCRPTCSSLPSQYKYWDCCLMQWPEWYNVSKAIEMPCTPCCCKTDKYIKNHWDAISSLYFSSMSFISRQDHLKWQSSGIYQMQFYYPFRNSFWNLTCILQWVIYWREIGLISEMHCYLQLVGLLGYVAAAGVVAQLSIQAIEDPNTPVEIYVHKH